MSLYFARQQTHAAKCHCQYQIQYALLVYIHTRGVYWKHPQFHTVLASKQYSHVKRAVLVFVLDNIWRIILVMVAVVDCGDPGLLSASTMSGSVFTYSSKVTYTCDPGFMAPDATNSLEIQCSAEGMWQGQGICKGNCHHCFSNCIFCSFDINICFWNVLQNVRVIPTIREVRMTVSMVFSWLMSVIECTSLLISYLSLW